MGSEKERIKGGNNVKKKNLKKEEAELTKHFVLSQKGIEENV